MLEPVGIFGAIRRAIQLTRQQFWRLLGLLLLVSLVVGFAGEILRLPFTLAGTCPHGLVGDRLRRHALRPAHRRRTVLSSAVLQPFQAAVNALLYVDQRIRKEAYDVELLAGRGSCR